MLQEISLFQESMGLMDEPLLSQFLRDSKNFESLDQPLTLFKYENEMRLDPQSGEILYYICIWYEGVQQRFKYTYERKRDEAEGKWKLKKNEFLDEKM